MPEFLALKHKSMILGHSPNPVFGFSMMEQVRLNAVLHMENWLGSSFNQIQGCATVRESYSRALEQGPMDEGERLATTQHHSAPISAGARATIISFFCVGKAEIRGNCQSNAAIPTEPSTDS